VVLLFAAYATDEGSTPAMVAPTAMAAVAVATSADLTGRPDDRQNVANGTRKKPFSLDRLPS